MWGITFLLMLIPGTALLVWLFWHFKKQSRFQTRLTVLLILFVIIPAIPFAWFTSTMMTRTSEIFQLNSVEEALDKSIRSLRRQFDKNVLSFLQSVNPDNVSQEMLTPYQIVAVGKVANDQIFWLQDDLLSPEQKKAIEAEPVLTPTSPGGYISQSIRVDTLLFHQLYYMAKRNLYSLA